MVDSFTIASPSTFRFEIILTSLLKVETPFTVVSPFKVVVPSILVIPEIEFKVTSPSEIKVPVVLCPSTSKSL